MEYVAGLEMILDGRFRSLDILFFSEENKACENRLEMVQKVSRF